MKQPTCDKNFLLTIKHIEFGGFANRKRIKFDVNNQKHIRYAEKFYGVKFI